ncbi:MAG: response regulator [Vicinamibacteria bacterium]|nr:response regulator [Vicinamibacteria bacterium]
MSGLAVTGIHVLLVEDSATQAEALRTLLTEAGFAVTVAVDGVAGLAAARRHAPAIVISDIAMPEMDGYALCQALKADPVLRDTPVILLTSLDDPRDLLRGLESGADNFVRKPCDLAHLVLRVRSLVANRELRGGARTRVGVEIEVGGRRHLITAERQQLLDLLVSTYEQAVGVGEELRTRERELTRSHQVLKAIHRIAERLNAATTERQVADAALQGALELPGVRAGWMVLRVGASGFRVAAARGMPPALAAPGAFVGDCRCRRLCLSGELGRTTSVLECERLEHAEGDTGGLRCHATVPLWTPRRTLGVLNLAGPDRGAFADDDVELLSGVGNLVGVALERAQLLERLEGEVSQRTAEYREILENSVVGIYRSTPEGRFAMANPMMARILGYETPEELIASLTDVQHQVYAQPGRRQEFLRAIGERGAVHGFESQAVRKDGSRIWISEDARPLRDAAGNLVGVEGIVLDVSARKAAEEDRERLVAILDATPDFVAIAEPGGRVLYLNRAARERLALGPDDDLGPLRVGAGQPEWVRRLILETALPAAIRQGTWQGETAFFDGGGHEVPYSQVVLAHKGSDGGVAFLSTIGRCLSEQKALEAQLRQAQKMEAIGQLAGGVAHDFNNILGVITGFAGILLARLPPADPLCRHAQEVANAAQRGAGLTRQLLAFSRQQALAPRVLDLNPVVSGMVAMLRRILGEDVDLLMALAPDVPLVRVDPGQVEQVLLNLAANARDAMPTGGRLTIETADIYLGEAYARRHVEVRAGPYTMIAVSDSGRGMDEQTQARIFDPFFTTKEPGKGTGLGLATVYGIVKQSGGHISLYSEPGVGTTFKVYLPQVGEEAETAASVEASAELAPTLEAPGGAETILVVEDEPALRAVIQEVLEDHGYTVLVAADGLEALAVAEAGLPSLDLLLTDVVMPRLNGPDLFARLARSRPSLLCLFMSGYTGHAALNNGAFPGGHGWLDKPFTPDGLLRKVREALDAQARESA